MTPQEPLINALRRLDLTAFLLPTAVYTDHMSSYYPWIGVRRPQGVELIRVSVLRIARTLEQHRFEVVQERIIDATREIPIADGFYLGLETLYFATDSEADPSQLERVRLYGVQDELILEFGISRRLPGLVYVNEYVRQSTEMAVTVQSRSTAVP